MDLSFRMACCGDAKMGEVGTERKTVSQLLNSPKNMEESGSGRCAEDSHGEEEDSQV